MNINLKNKNNLLRIIVLAIFLIIIFYLYISIINKDYPKVGHDYRIHISHMLDTHLHHRINGLSIQWYTPSFGSGLPAYPDPLNVQYSLPQFLMFFVNPWFALLISMIAYSTIGALAFYLFLKEELEMNWMSSVLGAIFIVVNGFYIGHMIVGHIGYQQFPMLGVILLALFSKRFNIIQAGLIIGITLALIINQAGFYLVVIFALSLLIILPLLYILRSSIFRWDKFSKISIAGSMLFLLLSASKLTAVFSFMRFFPREVNDTYNKTYFEGIFGLVSQLLGSMILTPFYLLSGRSASEVTVFLQKTTGSHYGLWETDISLTPVIFLLLLGGIVELGLQLRNKPGLLTKKKFIAVILLLLGIWLSIDYSLAQGWLYESTKALPIIKSLHVNVRFASAFIFPASILAASYFQTFYAKFKNINFLVSFLILSIFTILSIITYFLLDKEYTSNFNLQPSLKVYGQIEQGNTFPVNQIKNGLDDRVFQTRSSNLGGMNNAIFGYKLENFYPLTETGSVFNVNDGYYNMTNPASYVYPDENNLYVFERFRVDQSEELDLFVNRKQPHFNISLIQKLANFASLFTLIVISIYLIFIATLAFANLYKSSKKFFNS